MPPAEITQAPAAQDGSAKSGPNGRKTCVYLTVDTEASIGGALNDASLKPVGMDKRVYGRIGKGEYGIRLMMDIADRHGLKLTFYVETLCADFFGEQAVAEVCREIAGRGHDVQLHLHPAWQNFGAPNPLEKPFPDNMSSYNVQQQASLLRRGRAFLSGLGLPEPRAFRAGNYAGGLTTLQALAQEGFAADSSYNPSYTRGDWGALPQGLNDAAALEGVLEFPVTNYVERLPLAGQRFKTLDLNGASCAEMQWVLQHCVDHGFSAVTFILHSFSFLHPADVQYSRCGVRHYVIRRFERLCRLLAEMQPVLEVRTMSDPLPDPAATPGGYVDAPLPAVLRRIVQHRILG